MDVREKEIAERWQRSGDQVMQTAEAVAAGDLSLANTPAEIARRAERLGGEPVRLEALIGQDDMVWLSFFSRGLTAARPVGRVVIPGSPARAVGTGVLIGPSLLITNHHVTPGVADAGDLQVQFGYEHADDGTELSPTVCALDPSRGYYTDVGLDFTVVGVSDLDGAPPGARFGTVRLIAATGKVLKAECLNVVHHPGGDRKRVSVRENRMVAEDDRWIRYTSDTKEGSSGAPVFNDQWEMVALHHGGVTSAGVVANEGARVSRIVHALATARLDAVTRTAVEGIVSRA